MSDASAVGIDRVSSSSTSTTTRWQTNPFSQYQTCPWPSTCLPSSPPHSPISTTMHAVPCSTGSTQTVRTTLTSAACSLASHADMAPYYRIVTSSGALTADPALLESMTTANAEQLTKLDERLAEAEKTEGESEISDALKARANHLTRIGDKVVSLQCGPLRRVTVCRTQLWRPCYLRSRKPLASVQRSISQ